MPEIIGWLYKENPTENAIRHADTQLYKVRVRGEYIRYVHQIMSLDFIKTLLLVDQA